MPDSDPWTWHLRLGHRNLVDIRRAVRWNLISGIPFEILTRKNTVRSICDACARAKSTKYTGRTLVHQDVVKQRGQRLNVTDIEDPEPPEEQFVSDDEQIEEDNEPVETDRTTSLLAIRVGRLRDLASAKPLTNSISIMFTDMKGPFKVPGLKGKLYAQSFIEGKTKFLRRYYFQYKSEALRNLKHPLEVALKSEQTRLMAYCSDGAPELISRGCLALLAEHGCKFLYSPPYAPQLNAVVERNHRTTFESAHAMAIHSLLPNSLWTYAAEYATHIFNCLPTNTSSGFMSPYQARYGLVPDVSHLRM